MDPIAARIAAQQRAVQDALAGAVRALRAGQPGAWSTLLLVCFSYGLAHAMGPGHGKALIGGYGVARRVRVGPLIGLAVASSVAQALVAVLLVAGGAFAFGWTRPQMESLAETALPPLSYALISGLGLWLIWRGARGIRAARPAGHHDHDHHDDCGCGHAHGPTPAQVAQVGSLREAGLLIGAIALRPCSGALFLLVLTFALGIGWAGVAGTFAMGLGTASVTGVVAVLAVWGREGALATVSGSRLARVIPAVELALGAVIAVLALGMLAKAL
jgi:ABC-type nickel/cobalt efflux system permease component RcnA